MEGTPTSKPPVIARLRIKQFRSIPAETIELQNPLFLVGKNGSGKSNIADVLAFLAEAMSMPLQAVVDSRGGITNVCNQTARARTPKSLGIGVELGSIDPNVESGYYAFEIGVKDHRFQVTREHCTVRRVDGTSAHFDREVGGRFVSSVSGLSPVVNPLALCLPLVGGDERFAPILRALSGMRVYSINPQTLRDYQDPNGGVGLRKDGSNAASVIRDSGWEFKRRIIEMLSVIVPHTSDIRVETRGHKLAIEFTQEWGDDNTKRLKLESISMSDGTLRALGLLVALYQEPPPSLVVIEEPEATIHPGALAPILDALYAASRSTQVVVTTHSPELLDAAKWIEDQHLRVVTWHEGATRVTSINDASREALQNHLMGAGELLRTNVLRSPDLFPPPQQLNLF
jgi:predicted ATPase